MTNKSFFARRGFLIIVVAVFLMPMILRGTRLTVESNRNDVKDWLPNSFEETAVHTWFKEHFPHEQFVLASWEGCTLDDQRLRLLADKLETFDPNLSQLGIVGREAEALREQKLATLSALKDHPNLRTVPGITQRRAQELERIVHSWRSPFKSPVLTGARLVHEMKLRYPELSDEEVLTRLEGTIIGEDHSKTCLVVTLTDAAAGKQLRPTLEIIRDLARQCDIEPPVPERTSSLLVYGIEAFGGFLRELVHGRAPTEGGIRLGGPPVDNVAIDIEGERTLMRLAGLSLLIGVGVTWLCFHSVRLTVIAIFTSLLATGTSMASVFFSGETCDAILLTMPSLIYVLAISSAIHIINYYHDSIREHGLERAPERALAHAWLPCFLAAFTTALGLISLRVSHVIPISKFGLYSAWGVLATLAWVFLFVPACLHFFPSRNIAAQAAKKGPEELEDTRILRFWRVVGRFIIRRNGWVTAGCMALMVFLAVGITRIQTSVKLMKMFSSDAPIIADYAWLEEHLGPLVPMELVLRVDNQKCQLNMVERMRLAQHIEHTLEELPDIGGALSAATFAPDITPDRAKRGVMDIIVNRQRTRDQVLSKRLNQNRERFREYLTVDDGTGEELWRITGRVAALTDLDYGLFVDDIKANVEPLLAAYREAGVEGIDVTYTGLVPLVYKTQHELMTGLFQSLAQAFLLIALTMMLLLRSPSAGFISMVPNLFPVVVIFGVMGWMGILVDVGSMMTASVALGVAVDDTIHYLTWFRRGLDQGLDRRNAILAAYERCATAMTQTTFISGLGLAAFAFSTFTPTQRFGMLMLTLLFAALVGDLIFLPAVLSGPFGRFFRGRATKPAELAEEDVLDEDEVIAVPLAGKPPAPHTTAPRRIHRVS
ncbi:MAG: MMPL family transporter [Thermoguttaceae bacterium]|jgi:predicted RND superfamily exporter protein|nr:MMPL family transporter [Thermoguttaceae bacterium]